MSGQSAREALKEKDTSDMSEVICFYKYIKHGRQEKISMTFFKRFILLSVTFPKF